MYRYPPFIDKCLLMKRVDNQKIACGFVSQLIKDSSIWQLYTQNFHLCCGLCMYDSFWHQEQGCRCFMWEIKIKYLYERENSACKFLACCSRKSILARHNLTHSGKKEHICDVCGRSFYQKCDVVCHMRTHTGERPFVCKVCNRSFGHRAHLYAHIRTHSRKRSFCCDMCGSTFSSKYSLSTHLLIHTGEKPHNCGICEKSFSVKSNLYKHMRSHTGEKPHVCQVCGVSFTNKSALDTHVRIHTGKKPYRCSVCGKAFSVISNRDRHMKIHSEEKSSLILHVELHTGESPYFCSKCDTCFSRASQLNEHMKAHTGERPYGCTVCKAPFPLMSLLDRHMDIHIGEKVFCCKYCKSSFSHKSALITHEETHLSGDSESLNHERLENVHNLNLTSTESSKIHGTDNAAVQDCKVGVSYGEETYYLSVKEERFSESEISSELEKNVIDLSTIACSKVKEETINESGDSGNTPVKNIVFDNNRSITEELFADAYENKDSEQGRNSCRRMGSGVHVWTGIV
ncbi:hypothetical protein SK128_000585 [Halocaridina rubra]|uniref:C2H2-type domain-containing protein n=1 Tax=Halocaridina rubra TaxID=373956 RepID=A0AAN8XIG4_HALRR